MSAMQTQSEIENDCCDFNLAAQSWVCTLMRFCIEHCQGQMIPPDQFSEGLAPLAGCFCNPEINK
jgi:hypothetical protein